MIALLFSLVMAQESAPEYLIGKCVETYVEGVLHCSTRKDLCFVIEDQQTGEIRFHCKNKEKK